MAAFLSFIFLGGGQFYNGELGKVFNLWIISLFIAIIFIPVGGYMSGIPNGFVWIYSIVDAYVNAFDERGFKT